MPTAEQSPVVIAIDAGTTGVRARAVFADRRPSISSYQGGSNMTQTKFGTQFMQP